MRPDQPSLFAPWSLLTLRLVVGGGFAAHGIAKVERGADRFAEVLGALHVPAPLAVAWAVIGIEILGGVAVIAGLLVRPFAVLLAGVLLVAAGAVHLPFGFSSIKLISIGSAGPVFGPPGVELDVLYLAALGVLAAIGPGPTAAAWISKRSGGEPSHELAR